jgi:hypothetical protein
MTTRRRLRCRCDQCCRSIGTVQRAFICEPAGEPVEARLHQTCEAAFLTMLDDSKTDEPKEKSK